jgi:hypothetical protein
LGHVDIAWVLRRHSIDGRLPYSLYILVHLDVICWLLLGLAPVEIVLRKFRAESFRLISFLCHHSSDRRRNKKKALHTECLAVPCTSSRSPGRGSTAAEALCHPLLEILGKTTLCGIVDNLYFIQNKSFAKSWKCDRFTARALLMVHIQACIGIHRHIHWQIYRYMYRHIYRLILRR